MIKFGLAYLGIMLALYGTWFSLKTFTQTKEQKKMLRDTILTIATLMTMASLILAGVVILF